MNTHLEILQNITFQNITESVEQLLTNKHYSLELNQAAAKLMNSVQPCVKELKQSATRLKKLVQVGFNVLHHAEDVWNSKLKVAEASKSEIWEQIGQVSGCDTRICQIGRQYRTQAVQTAKVFWESKIELLRQQWFVDEKKQPKKGVGWSDKTGFTKSLDIAVDSLFLEIRKSTKHGLNLIYQELNTIQLDSIQHCISLLDQNTKNELSDQVTLIANAIETEFNKPTKHSPVYLKIHTIITALEALTKPGFGDIYWEQVVKFKHEVSEKIAEAITSLFDERVELATQAVGQVIIFYSDFLDKQQRYQQETLEQREAEKVWIDKQRQELEQVQYWLEAILNY